MGTSNGGALTTYYLAGNDILKASLDGTTTV
jgi:hypothetical protein